MKQKFGAGIWHFATYVDRYATDGYGEPRSVLDAISLAGQVKDLSVVDINFPYFGGKFSNQEIKNALDKVNAIRGVKFDWKDDHIEKRGGEDGYFVRKHDVGIVAQDVEKVLPEVVAKREDGTLGVKYEKLIGLLVQAINELSDKVNK